MTNHIRMKAHLITLMICFIVHVHAIAQNPKLSEPILVNGNSNEDSKALLDLLAGTAGKDKSIIMIARLGKKETSPKLNWRRLRTARSYLENVHTVPNQRIVLAAGEVVRGQGRVEVYLDGKLYMVFIFTRNKDFDPGG